MLTIRSRRRQCAVKVSKGAKLVLLESVRNVHRHVDGCSVSSANDDELSTSSAATTTISATATTNAILPILSVASTTNDDDDATAISTTSTAVAVTASTLRSFPLVGAACYASVVIRTTDGDNTSERLWIRRQFVIDNATACAAAAVVAFHTDFACTATAAAAAVAAAASATAATGLFGRFRRNGAYERKTTKARYCNQSNGNQQINNCCNVAQFLFNRPMHIEASSSIAPCP